MAGLGESMTSANRLNATERKRRALELRKAGYGFAAIADQLDYASPSGAHKAVMTALKETLKEPADELRTLELERLDQAWKAIYPSIVKGNFGAIDRGVKLMQRRAELLGLDAPKDSNLNLSGEVGVRRYIGVDPEAV
jgi:hypothetical protein